MPVTSEPLVSIALCTYNGEQYLHEQLESLLGQTYKNIEVIIVDDCSTDSTVAICKAYAAKDSRISIEANESNLGFNKNFEKCIRKCGGDYIAVSDQDDIWLSNKIETMLSQWKPDILLMHHASKSFEKHPLPPLTISKKYLPSGCTDVKFLLGMNHVQGCTVLFHKSLLSYIFPFPEIYYDWWLGLSALINGKIYYLNENLIYHRRHDSSAFFSTQKGKERAGYYREKKEISEEIRRQNILIKEEDKKYLDEMIDVYRRLCNPGFSFSAFLWMIKNRKYRFWRKNYKRFPFFSRLLASFKEARGS